MSALDKNKLEELKSEASKLYKENNWEEALKLYEQILETEPESYSALFSKAYCLGESGKYEAAVLCYDGIPKDYLNYWLGQLNKGICLGKLGFHQEAIICYDGIPEDNLNYWTGQYNKSFSFSHLGKYESAVACCESVPKNSTIYWGAQYYVGYNRYYVDDVKDIEAAKISFREFIKVAPNNEFYRKGFANLVLGNSKEAAQCFVEAKDNALNILTRFKDEGQIKEVISLMLDKDDKDFFNQTLRNWGEKKEDEKIYGIYKDIYITTLQTIFELHVNREEEVSFAHYTRKDVAELMLFAESPLRLASTVTSNDPKEGLTLLDFLSTDQCTRAIPANNDVEFNVYQAFITCFTFNHNCLNQFRLYGKEKDREATGVSIVLNKSFFASDANAKIVATENSKDESDKNLPLYRCMYIDPDMRKVISLGHKDEYAFYVEDPKELKGTINEYNKYINQQLRKVESNLRSLSDIIQKNSKVLKKEIVNELLLPLRYLVKHIAFKEEQECRILDIEKLGQANKKIKCVDEKNPNSKYRQLYIEKQILSDKYVDKVYFAPKASDFELFKNVAVHLGRKFRCYKSNHPFEK